MNDLQISISKKYSSMLFLNFMVVKIQFTIWHVMEYLITPVLIQDYLFHDISI